MAETTTVQTTQRRPEYIEQREQLLLDQIFGTPTTADDGSVTYSGGLIDASKYPDLFTIPEYKQAALAKIFTRSRSRNCIWIRYFKGCVFLFSNCSKLYF